MGTYTKCLEPYTNRFTETCLSNPTLCRKSIPLSCKESPLLCKKTAKLLERPQEFEDKYGDCKTCYAAAAIAVAVVATAMHTAAGGSGDSDRLPPELVPGNKPVFPPLDPDSIDPSDTDFDF